MPKRLFISYSHADDRLLDRLHKHLAQLKREGSVSEWYDREITVGGRLHDEIERELSKADVYLAAVSPDFIASAYCYDVELQKALQREEAGRLTIVPVVFEPCDWLATPLAKFKALPKDGKAISEFSNENVALLSVIGELRRLINEADRTTVGSQSEAATVITERREAASRYRLRRDFDKIDKRDFAERAFQEIKRFFESSVAEISVVPEIEAQLIERGPDRFSCTIINRGLRRGIETITVRRGGSFGDIDVIYGDRPAENTSNGGFYIEADEYEMFLRSGFFSFGSDERERQSPHEAARLLWDDLLSKVGVDYA